MTFWLIEMVHNDGTVPRYWNHSKHKGGWIYDANEAMQFAREQDARDFLDGLHCPLQGKPTEHKMIAASQHSELADRLEKRLADILAKHPLANTLPLVEREIQQVLRALRSPCQCIPC